uniref:Queuosine 5'-phosphate N-glycosylase/hydrolase n=1 Tax=Mucochytrium quahogii TaxID=96639 RepID=A0A7S2RJ48_9STRA|mmetsp:Transcript_17797/g.28809  ORF Transcript_17797/g.28809 Transcript_17797/m.28809 type:complete len:316 (-) Transcript_17797:906-1853(-)
MSCVGRVVESTRYVVENSDHVRIDDDEIQRFAEDIGAGSKVELPDWEASYHFKDVVRPDATAQYVFVVDALNFCFWPLEGYEYEHLALAFKLVLERDPEGLSCEKLESMTEERLEGILLQAWNDPGLSQPPLLKERVRLLKELGQGLRENFQGQALNVVKAAHYDSLQLAQLVIDNFPGFRDQAMFKGHDVFLYKRCQILVGDIEGALKGTQGFPGLSNIEKITCFADYRLPQLLRFHRMLKYSHELSNLVDQKVELKPGSSFEVEIRAATIHAVARLSEILGERMYAVDWLLWNTAETQRNTLPAHHLTLTTFY